MYIEKYRLIVPAKMNIESAALAATMQEHSKIQAFTGNKAVSNYGISIVGSGAWAKGNIHGSMKGNDYKAIYKVYNVKDSKSCGWWVFKYKEDESHDELKKVFEDSKEVNLEYNLDFEIQGNDYGINAVYITYEVIRLAYNGVSRDFVITNNESAGAVTPDGEKYPGGFKPIGK